MLKEFGEGFVALQEKQPTFKGKAINPDAWPIQIRNGLITIDFGSGCLGCAWCITKRQPGREILQDTPYRNHLEAGSMLSLLRRTRAFTEAKLPLRIGNNTDGTLIPVDILRKFYGALPDDYPVALLTRGLHSAELNDFLSSTGKNFVLCRTVTPPHPSLNYRLNWERALHGFNDLECQKVLNIGPLVYETLEFIQEILKSGQIPEGTPVIISPLNIRLLPRQVLEKITAEPLTNEQLSELEKTAIDCGLRIHRSNNCAVAEYSQRPSIDYADINYDVHSITGLSSSTQGTSTNRGLDSVCTQCTNYAICSEFYQGTPFVQEKNILNLANSLGLKGTKIEYQIPGLIIVNSEGITKSETSYMTGRLGVRVTGIDSLAQPNQRALERWIKNRFYPVKSVIKLSNPFDPLQVSR